MCALTARTEQTNALDQDCDDDDDSGWLLLYQACTLPTCSLQATLYYYYFFFTITVLLLKRYCVFVYVYCFWLMKNKWPVFKSSSSLSSDP